MSEGERELQPVGAYNALIDSLVEDMRSKLDLPRNRAKEPPETLPIEVLLDMLAAELAELRAAATLWRYRPYPRELAKLRNEACDVANMAVLIVHAATARTPAHAGNLAELLAGARRAAATLRAVL